MQDWGRRRERKEAGSVWGANCRGRAIRNRLGRRGTRHNNNNKKKNYQVGALGLDLGKRINKESAGLGKKKGKEGSRGSFGSQLSRTGH